MGLPSQPDPRSMPPPGFIPFRQPSHSQQPPAPLGYSSSHSHHGEALQAYQAAAYARAPGGSQVGSYAKALLEQVIVTLDVRYETNKKNSWAPLLGVRGLYI